MEIKEKAQVYSLNHTMPADSVCMGSNVLQAAFKGSFPEEITIGNVYPSQILGLRVLVSTNNPDKAVEVGG